MINMCHYTEIPESFDWYVFYTPLKLRDCPGSLSASCHRGGKGPGLGEEPGSILGSDRAREPQELQWASLHLWNGAWN
jgi:hypothetical protein